jgi:preprotein translocase subunit SecD
MAQKFSGAVQITGDFTERHARALAATLNSGGLPFTLSVTSVVFTP